MSEKENRGLSRRGLLAGAGVAAAGAVAGTMAPGTADAAPASATAPEPAAFGPVSVRPADVRYDSLIRGNNWRFVGTPDEVRVVGSTEQVVRAVADAVRTGRRIAPRSGGHCFENFTADGAVRMLLDLSPMDAVGYDAGMRAFAVQPGAPLGHVYRTLLKGWGVTIPAGGCPEVGAGGHFAGGGYGPLSRRFGSVVDHLYAVEVVVVGRDGTVRPVIATREPEDPNRELWWAHTGGGGGNFGVVTRYWLRSPGAAGTDPTRLLPRTPREMLESLTVWSWDTMTEASFTGLLRAFGTWHERNSAPGAPGTGLDPVFLLTHRKATTFSLVVQADAGLPDIQDLLGDFLKTLTDVATPAGGGQRTFPWLHPLTWPGTGEPGDVLTRRYKIKAGYLRRSFTAAQLAAIHRNLTNDTGTSNGGMLMIGYGGQVSAVPPGETAVAQRDVIMKVVYQALWTDPAEDADNLAWVRALYRDVYAETRGVPVPGDVNDGSYVNYPDNDLADPAWNTSGVPWSTLYYKDDYPRLQRAKARWDPRNVFRHTLSVEPPA